MVVADGDFGAEVEALQAGLELPLHVDVRSQGNVFASHN